MRWIGVTVLILCMLVCGVSAASNVVVWGNNVLGHCNVPDGINATDIACGSHHTLVIDTDGYVHAWGYNRFGDCDVPAGLQATHVAGGISHSLAIDMKGYVHAWGDNGKGQCDVPAGLQAIAIDGGNFFSAAINLNGEVVVWGGKEITATYCNGLQAGWHVALSFTVISPRMYIPFCVNCERV